MYVFIGFLAGVLNSIFGSGGGLLIVPTLIKAGMETKKAHANSICIILFISLISIFNFIISNFINIGDMFPISFYGFLGSFVGTFVFKKIKVNILRFFFACMTILASLFLIFR